MAGRRRTEPRSVHRPAGRVEAGVGVLAISGGRWSRLGYAAVIAFYLALWLFGWMETVWCLVMLPAMVPLSRAEQHARATADVAVAS